MCRQYVEQPDDSLSRWAMNETEKETMEQMNDAKAHRYCMEQLHNAWGLWTVPAAWIE